MKKDGKINLKYSNKKDINPNQLLELYKSVNWANKEDKLNHGKLISRGHIKTHR